MINLKEQYERLFKVSLNELKGSGNEKKEISSYRIKLKGLDILLRELYRDALKFRGDLTGQQKNWPDKGDYNKNLARYNSILSITDKAADKNKELLLLLDELYAIKNSE